MLLLILLSLSIGLLLGLLGGGGSILTVPVMVYVVGLTPKAAVVTSLIVVSVTSLIALGSHARNGRVCWKTGFVFGLAGMAGGFGGGRLAALIPGQIQLLLFAVVMAVTAVAMLRGRPEGPPRPGPICPLRLNRPALLFDGLLVGVLNGLVGVGGGFVIVPALNLLAGLPIHAAIGTSLLVIAMNSAAALAGYAAHARVELPLLATVTVATVAGSLIGARWSQRCSGPRLRQGFGVFVLGLAAYLLHRELSRTLWQEILAMVIAHRDFGLGMATVIAVLLLSGLRRALRRRQVPPAPGGLPMDPPPRRRA